MRVAVLDGKLLRSVVGVHGPVEHVGFVHLALETLQPNRRDDLMARTLDLVRRLVDCETQRRPEDFEVIHWGVVG